MDTPRDALRPDELVEHAGFLRALARSLVDDAARAEDLVQDTWVAALERPPPRGGSPRGWLATVARHLASNMRRAEARRAAREVLAARDEALPGADAARERLELSHRLSAAVLALREPFRTTIYLRYHEGLGPRAIAARTGVPVKTVKSRLTRALAELRERLGERDGRSRAPALIALAYPGAGASAAGALATVAGALAMKKFVVACAVLAALSLSWLGWRRLSQAAAPVERPSTIASGASGAQVELTSPAPRPPEAPASRQPLPAMAPIATAGEGSLVVEVVWQADGSPISGLCMDVLCLDDPAPRRRTLHGLTGEDGRARFEALPGGRARVFAPTGAAASAEVRANETTTCRLEIPSAISVRGSVIDPGGRPVGGAEIWARNGISERGHMLTRARPDGHFELHGLGMGVELGARAEGWQPSLLFEAGELPVGPTGAREARLELRAGGGGVAGRVVAPDGTPVSDAHVLVGAHGGFIVDLPDGRRGYSPGPPLLRTAEDGTFSHPGLLPPGVADVHVAAHGHPLWYGSVQVAEGQRAWLEVRLEPAARIAGRVVDPMGAPVAGAEVRVTREIGLERQSDPFVGTPARTDEQGLFVLEWFSPGTRELIARVEGRDRLGRARAIVTCAPGEQREVELVLELGATIRGRVVDAQRRPLAGWNVSGESTGFVLDPASGMHRGLGLVRHDTTDADGGFLLPNLHEGALEIDWGMTLTVKAPGETATRAELRGVRPGARGVELVVERAETTPAWLRGQVLDGTGAVPQDVRVTVWGADGMSGHYASFDLATGRFEHESPMPGRYDVRVLRGGNTVVSSGPHELSAGQTLDLGVLSLGAPGRVELRLHGIPPQDAVRVHAVLETPRAASEALIDEGGVLRSRPLAPGPWNLRVESKIWFVADRELVVREGETTTLALEAVPAFPVDLAFHLADAEAAWTSVEVELQDASGATVRRYGPRSRALLGDGTLTIHALALPPGRYTVTARTDGGHVARGELEIVDHVTARGPHRFELR